MDLEKVFETINNSLLSVEREVHVFSDKVIDVIDFK